MAKRISLRFSPGAGVLFSYKTRAYRFFRALIPALMPVQSGSFGAICIFACWKG